MRRKCEFELGVDRGGGKQRAEWKREWACDGDGAKGEKGEYEQASERGHHSDGGGGAVTMDVYSRGRCNSRYTQREPS